MSIQPEIIIRPDGAVVQQAAAEYVATLIQKRVEARGAFTLVLAGGNTPRGLYQRLTDEPFHSQVPWEQVHVVWGDERYVPYADGESNYQMARESFLMHVPIPQDQVYPIPTHYPTPHKAATIYARMVEMTLEMGEGLFDLVILGIGADGHTASLFPHHPALDTSEDILVVAVENAPKPPPQRVSLTAATLSRAACVLFLATGAEKAEAIHATLHGPPDPYRWPAQRIQPPAPAGKMVWFVDSEAGEHAGVDRAVDRHHG